MAPSTDPSASRLFKPLKVGRATLSSRLALAPLTRFRASREHVPAPYAATYYAQRACVPGTLLVTEATFISARAGGFPFAPGIYTDAQVAGWRDIVSAVHAAGGVIYLQLWALGRAAKGAVLAAEPGGPHHVVSSGDAPFDGGETPRAIPEADVPGWVADYATAARRAVLEAGFDGVEIHAANGYLIDQFTQSTSNTRTDGYGGSVEKRARFALEVARAVVAEVGADRTGIRLSPWGTFQGMRIADDGALRAQFAYLLAQLRPLGLAYLHVTEPRVSGGADRAGDVPAGEDNAFVYEAWAGAGPILVAGGLTAETARQLVDEEQPGQDIVATIGRYWISTPDLVYRTKKGIPWTKYDRNTFYSKGEQGYTDWPVSDEFKQEVEGGEPKL